MATYYSTNLGITLQGTGDNAGTWGDITNTNLGTLLEKAISGYYSFAISAGDNPIYIPDGADGIARNMYISLTGTGGGTVTVPAGKNKLYFIQNTTASAVTVRTSAATPPALSVSVPSGAKVVLVCTGNDIINATSYPINTGTTNQVAYNNATGLVGSSSLTFDGTNLATTGTASATKFIPTGGTATGNGMYLSATDTVSFSTAGSERVRIDSSGNLLLNNGAALAWKNSGGTTLNMLAIDGGNNFLYGYGGSFTGLHAWYSNSSQIMTLSTGGTLSFSNSLTLQGGSSGLGLASGNSSQPVVFYVGQFGVSAAEKARIDNGGIFMVGKAASAATSVGFEVSGSGEMYVTRSGSTSTYASYYLYSTGAGAYRFYVGMDGTVNATNTTIAGISDQRLKENIRDLDVGLDAIMALKPRKFDWKAGKGKDIKDDRGFIAQEFEQVFPDLIGEWKDPAPNGEAPYKSVKQDLIPILVKAIQEQQAMIEDLRARVAALEAKA